MTNRQIVHQGLWVLLLLTASAPSLLAQTLYAQGRIDTGLVVFDLDQSVAFYENALGLQRAYTFDVDSSFARRAGLTEGAPLHAVAMRLRNEEDAPVLKLVRVGTPDTHRPRFIDEQAGVRYLTLFVTALEPVLERLKQHRVPVLGEGPVPLSNGQYFALVQDPDGVFVELIGPMHASSGSP